MLEAIYRKNNLRLVIEDAGKELGYYLYVFNIGEIKSKADHLCDDLQQAYYVAYEDYGVLESDFKFTATK